MIRVIKIGGNVVDDADALRSFCRDFSSLEGPKVLVHGGGAVASHLQEALGQTPVRIEGRRVTDAATLDVCTMVYSGLCNKTIVALLQGFGCNALGLSGCDGNAVKATKRPPIQTEGHGVVDFGFVGDVTPASVNAPLLTRLLSQGITPVLCAINHDAEGQLLNTNADTMASSVAAALGAELTVCFELDGVLKDSEVIPSIDIEAFKSLKADGTVSGGMIPKLQGAFDAIRDGALKVVVKNSRDLLLEGAGTVING